MKAIIPAAGQGSRLRPLTDTTPKPLVEVCGAPILEYCFDRLATADIDEAIVIVGYRGEQIIHHFGDAYAGMPLTYVWQNEREGMAHALLQAREHVRDDFVVIDGDNVITADLTPLIERQRDAETSAVLLLDELSAEEAREKAICDLREDGTMSGITNKPDDPPDPSYVAGGFHTFSPDIFTACDLVEKSPRGEYELSKAIELLIEAGHDVRGVTYDSWTANINTQADLREAEAYLREHPSLVPENV